MSYNKMMKWNKRHRRGTRQPMLMHTNSGFWPSGSFLDKYFIYKAMCEENNIIPLECEEYYKSQLR